MANKINLTKCVQYENFPKTQKQALVFANEQGWPSDDVRWIRLCGDECYIFHRNGSCLFIFYND